jgi:hypothetical protein
MKAKGSHTGRYLKAHLAKSNGSPNGGVKAAPQKKNGVN